MSSQLADTKAGSPPESAKGKYRAKQSCIPCRTRKVKCDRIKPCQACCVRGLPSECEYVTTNEDRFLISQADAIEGLRSEVTRLKQRLAAANAPKEAHQHVNASGSPQSSSSSSSSSPPLSSSSSSTRTGVVPYQKYATLQSIMTAIASASPDVVASTVAQVRNGVPLENVAQLASQLTDDASLGFDQGVAQPTEYPPFSNTEDPDYSESKRVKREPDPESDDPPTATDNQPYPPFLPVNQPYSIALRGRQTVWNGGTQTQAVEADGNGLNQDDPYLTSLSKASRKRQRSPAIPPQRMSGRNATMEIFLGRYVDAFSPKIERGWGSSTTMRSAAGIRMFSPILCDALEAVSVTYFGQSTNDSRLEAAAYDTYLSVLRNLQHALYDAEQSKSQAILLTVTVLMAFECIQRTTTGSIVNHSVGALRLIEYRGPHRHIYGVEHMFFTEFRPYLASIALVVRKPTFLQRDEWKTVPWSAGSSVKDSLQLLLDIVVDIPAFLSEFDRFMLEVSSGNLPSGEVSTTQSTLWSWVAQLDRRLREWKREWVDSQLDGPAKEGSSLGDDQFPVFRCRDLDTLEIVTPKPLLYADLRHAQAMCIYYSAHLVLGAADTRPVGSLTPKEQHEFACNICRSMEFYIRTIPGGLINRLAFPLRAAYDALPEGDVERQFVEDVFHLVETKFNLRLWGSTIPEISTRKNYG